MLVSVLCTLFSVITGGEKNSHSPIRFILVQSKIVQPCEYKNLVAISFLQHLIFIYETD